MNVTNIRGRARYNTEWLWIAAVLCVASFVHLQTFSYLWTRWDSDAQYSLAFLVPFVSAYFVWKSWGDVRSIERRGSVWGLVVALCGLVLHVVASIVEVKFLSSISLLPLIIGLLAYLHSTELVRKLWFPIAYLIFAIPMPGGTIDRVGLPLQLWASAGTEILVRTLGIDIVRNGVNLSVPGFDFEVAIACSGMSSLVALVGVTAVFAYVTQLPAALKWVLFLLALPIALGANLVRIVTIALVGYEWGGDVAMKIYHDWSSPLLFMVAIALTIGINALFERICTPRIRRGPA